MFIELKYSSKSRGKESKDSYHGLPGLLEMKLCCLKRIVGNEPRLKAADEAHRLNATESF